jgi:hypothetical protein
MEAPRPDDLDRVALALGVRPVSFSRVTRGGQTAASRWIAGLPGGDTVFLKIGAALDTASWIRDEHLFYARHRGLAFLPALRGWHDDGERPVLALEDLSAASWPPPWDAASVDAVLETLAAVHATTPNPDLVPIDSRGIAFLDGWRRIQDDPAPALALQLFDADWLARHGPLLHDVAMHARVGGDALLHLDVRSDNLCVRDGRALLVDWSWASIGNPAFDVAAWLPSLHAEGGPAPETIMPEGATFAAMLAGFFTHQASRPPIREAPHVRPVQLRQARSALPWAARAVGIPSPI